MNGKIKRIFLESTCSLDTNFTTGIQRVVRSVISEMDALSRRIGVECVPVVFRKDRFYDARMAWQRRNRKKKQGGQPTLRRLSRELDRLSPRAAQFYSSARIRMRKMLYPKTLCRVLTNAKWQLGAEPVSFCDTDILLLLDETWRVPIWPTIEHARTKGCCVGSVVYDLIPIDHPHFFQSEFVRLFTEGTKTLLQHSDFFLPISETVAGRLKAHINTVLPQDQDFRRLVTPFRLGAATVEVPPGGSVYPRLHRLFNTESGKAPFLCVGTLEPRKNHEYLLDAFEAIWRRSPLVKLCIAGRVGWKCQHILERIRLHPQFGKSLFLFTDLNDVELFFCYRQAKALVSCSVDEGFDLPVVEGLRHGLRVLASDIPIHREIGRDSCDYFDLANPESLARLVLDMERQGVSSWEERLEKSNTTTWRESCNDLLAKALAMTAVAKAERARVLQGGDLGGTRNRDTERSRPTTIGTFGSLGTQDVQVRSC